MIQRIQTLLLLIVTLLCALLIIVPIYELVDGPSQGTAGVTTQFTILNSAILAIINAGVAILSFVAIFLYKKRNLQIRASNLALLINCILIGLLFFSADTMSTTLQAKVHYLYGSYIPILNAIMLFMAIRYIKRDEELVRSSDRLR